MKPFKHARLIHLRHQRLWLLPQKAIFWEKENVLMIADPHFGKVGHFRRNGIPVPASVNNTNFELLNALLKAMKIDHLIILGDLFHSRQNREWEQFFEWRSNRPELKVTLVIGNHDILDRQTYHASRINLFHKLRMKPFLLVHDLNSFEISDTDTNYLLSGHIHPAVQLRGKGRQSMKLPCYFFGKQRGVIPAFGEFTGTHVIKPGPGDRIYAIVKNQIVPVGDNA